MTQSDDIYMQRALELAERGRFNVSPNPLVGCVIVKDGQIIGEGWHERVGHAHAEVNALKNATESVAGSTVYVTLEPCSHFGRTPPCVNALIDAKVSRVVIACQDSHPNVSGQGIAALNAAGITTKLGILETQARWQNRGFFHRIHTKRPWVTAKIAASLDGKTALKNGQSKWITSEAARADVQQLRAASDAIITGIGTVLADNPQMNVRIDGKDSAPQKIIFDRHLRTPASAQILSDADVLIVHTSDHTLNLFTDRQNVQCLCLPDPPALIDYLGAQQMNYVMLEAGATLSGEFVRQGLVNELIVYLSPDVLGADARSMLAISGITDMNDKISFEFQDIRQIGRDVRITLIPA